MKLVDCQVKSEFLEVEGASVSVCTYTVGEQVWYARIECSGMELAFSGTSLGDVLLFAADFLKKLGLAISRFAFESEGAVNVR